VVDPIALLKPKYLDLLIMAIKTQGNHNKLTKTLYFSTINRGDVLKKKKDK
jgi:hypothetical protein